MAKMKPSQYGGSDTTQTLGLQPAPHQLTADEKLRVMYATDPMREEPEVIPNLRPEDMPW